MRPLAGRTQRKKWDTRKLRSHGICVVGRLPKDTDAHEKRFPGTERLTSARSSHLGICRNYSSLDKRHEVE
jgi:hypothetical protein